MWGYLVNITEVQVFSVGLILECMNEGWISGSEPCFSQYLVLLSVLALEMEAEIYDSQNHTDITSQVNAPGNVVPGSIFVKEYLGTF